LERTMIEPAVAIPPALPEHNGYPGISTVLEKLADITLYNLHTRLMPDNIPKLRQTRYDNAIAWLEKVADGFIAPILPIKTNSPTTPLRYGNSSTTQNPYY
ncbi:MAG: phage protein Gp36 family protein, partial [Bacteroidales bacterium]